MKLALVTPVYKGKSKLEICNYRPVSILPILSKVLEKLMVDRVTVKWTYLFMNTSLNFKKKKRKKKSTTSAVLDIYTNFFNSLDKGDLACIVFLDFAKAFDSVDHKSFI